MTDAKSTCVACIGIFIVLAIIGGVLNIIGGYMGWEDPSSSNSVITLTPTSASKNVKSEFKLAADESSLDYDALDWDEEKSC